MNVGNMDLTTMLSSQIITMTGMKDGNIMNAIYGIIALTIFNKLVAAIPELWKAMCSVINYYFSQKKNEFVNKTIANVVKKRVGTIKFEKLTEGSDGVVIVALINYISGIKSSKHLVYNNDYFVVNTEEFLLKPDVFCKVLSFNKDDKGKITGYNFEIYSYVYDIEYLKDFVNNIRKEYEQERSNNLGKQPYFFNEIPFNVPREMGGGYRLEAAPKQINFDMTPFFTNKSLMNVFGSHLDVVKKRVDMFINNPRWYEEKGIPYTLGILLSGPPGTGKTSLIKAIAKDTKRHIFNINLRQTTTQSQLRNLFYDTEIRILRNGRSEIINIPLEKRIYVIEDIDCLSDVVIDRAIKAGSAAASPDVVHNSEAETDMEPMDEPTMDASASPSGSATPNGGNSPPPHLRAAYATGQAATSFIKTGKQPAATTGGSPSNRSAPSDINNKSVVANEMEKRRIEYNEILGNPNSNAAQDPNYIQSSFMDEQFATLNAYEKQQKANMKPPTTAPTPNSGRAAPNSGRAGMNEQQPADDDMLPGMNAFSSFGGSFSGFEEINEVAETPGVNNNASISKGSSSKQPVSQSRSAGSSRNITTKTASSANDTSYTQPSSDVLKYNPNVIEPIKQQHAAPASGGANMQYANAGANANAHPEELNLSFLLNLLDGVLETPGRILIVTSNYPERLDKALIRPGRIDINLNVGYCSRSMIIDMCRFFYDNRDINIPESEWAYGHETITPAEMHKILLNNFDNFDGCLAELKKQSCK